jgi:hypothetical protein
MPSIKISDNEVLDAKLIQSFKASEQGPEQECVLTITTTNGETITLLGEMAGAALAILRLHGF